VYTGGENVFPVKIEERLLEHPSIPEASVVATKNEKYGEFVGAFLRTRKQSETIRSDAEEVDDGFGWHGAYIKLQHIYSRWVRRDSTVIQRLEAASFKHAFYAIQETAS